MSDHAFVFQSTSEERICYDDGLIHGPSQTTFPQAPMTHRRASDIFRGHAACIGRLFGAALAISVGPIASAQGAGTAGTRIVCGIPAGTAGNAELAGTRGQTMVILATQGGDQHLLDEADTVVGADPNGETGTQNGTRYCLTIRFDAAGKPVGVLKGRCTPK